MINLARPLDNSTQAFYNACRNDGVTLTSSQTNALDILVKRLKQTNLWDRLQVCYPIIGGVAASHKYNLKDPRDLNAANRMTFFGSPTHSNNGIDWNGATQYADSNFSSQSLTQNDTHISYYSRTASSGISCVEFGMSTNTIIMGLLLSRPVLQEYGGDAYSVRGFFANTNATGFYVDSKSALTNHDSYKNGVLRASEGNATTQTINAANLNFFLGCRNNNNFPNVHSPRSVAFASIGRGLSDSQNSTYYSIVQSYQTMLGRQV